ATASPGNSARAPAAHEAAPRRCVTRLHSVGRRSPRALYRGATVGYSMRAMSAAGGSAAASEPSPTDEHVRFERLIADLSARFVNLPAADVGAHIVDALRSISEFLDMDRGFLIEVREGSDELPVTWRFIGDLPLLGHRFAVHQYPWYAGSIRAGQAIVLPRLPDDLPIDSHEARQTFAELNIEIFASALERKRLDEQLSQRLEFETLPTEVSSSLTH